MLLKVKISKAFPSKSLDYGTSKNILEREIKRNLFSSELTPAEEMIRTAQHFGKWKSPEDRKTFSIVISPDPKDNPTEEQLVDVVNAVLDMFFSTNQGVIVLHKDKAGTADADKYKPVLHAHFFGSIIDPTTGKNIHLSQKDLNNIRRWAEDYAEKKYGWTPLKKSKDLRRSREYKMEVLRALQQRGSYSWRLKMAEIIEQQYAEASSFNDFLLRLKNNGINIYIAGKSKKTGEVINLSEPKFSFKYRSKTLVVKATSISNRLTLEQLKIRFPELGGPENGKNIRRPERESRENEQLGKRSYSDTASAGENSGQRQNGQNGRIDYDCLFCSHDKLICKDCCRDEKRKGGVRYERNERTR